MKTSRQSDRRSKRLGAWQAWQEGTAVPRLGMNLVLTALIFISPLMVAVLGNHDPETGKEVALLPPPSSPFGEELSTSPRMSILEEKIFLRHAERRLPRYLAAFQREAQRRGFSWTLLASQAYQESHWNPRARSYTGVRGIMQLTRATSVSLGVTNRLDPMQSISGGAWHLARLHKQLPAHIQEPDRTWIALAAYNVGMGHINDARRLAFRLGKNPDRWSEFKEILPLLAKRKYYTTLRHGYARGWEPVRYVERIRVYWALLHKHSQDSTAVLPEL